MRTMLRPILFLGITQFLTVESLARQGTTVTAKVTNNKTSSRYRDPLLAKILPNRTLASNEERIKSLAIALQNADKVLNGKRSRKNEQSEKPRTFGSPIMAAELRPRSDNGPSDFPRRNVRLPSRPSGRYSTPSSVLLPPYKSYTPEFDFDNDKPAQLPSPTKKNDVATTELPDNTSFGRSKSHESISSYSLRDGMKNSSARHGSDENDIGRFFVPQKRKETFGNRQEYPSDSSRKTDTKFPPYWGSTASEPLKIRLNPNATVEFASKTRGSDGYNQKVNENEISKKKDILASEESGYHWGRRPVQTVNHYKFVDTAWKVDAIPGIAGQDYPVHQHHEHNHLRYPSSRFVCPVGPGTHIYLADRASRCQIFYVCYGEKTGVPMMCPNGTLFSEHLQVCDWWFNVAC
ncbi:uncharacterized protein LOC124408929 [Diprion similis]|uniref:uncharacterized protein LOC124408929 n=1 Tax=Diprion similis TaxID=362088 RepID=UPI001EF914C2|nr:uncharacterized protein LOC124408929 [Diprion similis]XP_046742200.1 uncharacterized protein LOC124408929 [Diprion similis]